MEWTSCIKRAIDYMEKNLLTVQGPEEVAEHAFISSMYLQKGFQIMTGYSLGEYMRNRRLYLAALDLINTDEKIIDVAYNYGYETPESFTKAFTRFHNATPSDVRKKIKPAKIFLPLKVNIVVQGGNDMDFKIETFKAFKVIGFVREFESETATAKIPEFWGEIQKKYCSNLFAGLPPANEIETALRDNHVGEFGICIDDKNNPSMFRYVIGGVYSGGKVPEGMEVIEMPEMKCARFDCVGPVPGSVQSVNAKIWNEWLPGNTEYELDGNVCIEWYSPEGNPTDANYRTYSAIPVKRKKA